MKMKMNATLRYATLLAFRLILAHKKRKTAMVKDVLLFLSFLVPGIHIL
jgi:hypothetical protein